MQQIVASLTILASVLLILWWPAIRTLAAFRRPAAGVLRDNEFGLARITLPPRWRPAAHLNEQASLQATDPLRHRYVIVISEALVDFEEVDLVAHAAGRLALLVGSLRLVGFQGPEERHVGDRRAIQYEIDAFLSNTRVRYLHTTIAGSRAFHQILAWSPYSQFDRDVFERLVDSFVEEDGPPAPSRPRGVPVLQPSRYDVH